MNIFSSKSYRDVITAYLVKHEGQRGYRAILAEAAGCQRAYLSQVMRGDAHLTADHAVGLALFWELNDVATEYFLNLVQYERASQKKARKFFLEKLERIRAKQHDVAQHIAPNHREWHNAPMVYYSNWLYSAIHVLLSIKELQTEPALAAKLQQPVNVIRALLSTLQELGLVQHSKGRWGVTERSLHITKDAPGYFPYFTQWRMNAMQAFQRAPNAGIHYTALHALSLEDATKVREEILQLIQKTRRIVEPSLEETAIVVAIDCFDLG
jgi:uncharacterized protein (TIGR02147 family)